MLVHFVLLSFILNQFNYVVSYGVIVKCIHGCTINGDAIETEDGGYMTLMYAIAKEDFFHIDIKYNKVDLVYAYKDLSIVSRNKNQRFHFPKKLRRGEGRLLLEFNMTEISILADDQKRIEFIVDFRTGRKKWTSSHVVNVFARPKFIIPPQKLYTVGEYEGQTVRFELRGKPPPIVTAVLAGQVVYVFKNNTKSALIYGYEATLENLKRDQCGKEMKFQATTYVTVTFNTKIIVSFTPSVVKHVYAYLHRNNFSVSWSEIESGDCEARYEVQYIKSVHSSSMMSMNYSGSDIDSVAVRAVVNGIVGPFSTPVIPSTIPPPTGLPRKTIETTVSITSPTSFPSTTNVIAKTVSDTPFITKLLVQKSYSLAEKNSNKVFKQKFFLYCIIGGLCLIIIILLIIVIKARKYMKCGQQSQKSDSEEEVLMKTPSEDFALSDGIAVISNQVTQCTDVHDVSPYSYATTRDISGVVSQDTDRSKQTVYKTILSPTVDSTYTTLETDSGPNHSKMKNPVVTMCTDVHDAYPYSYATTRGIAGVVSRDTDTSNQTVYKTILSPTVDSTYAALETDSSPNHSKMENPVDEYGTLGVPYVSKMYAALESIHGEDCTKYKGPEYAEIATPCTRISQEFQREVVI